MVDVRPAPSSDFDALYRMLCERTGEREEAAVREWYDAQPELFLGAYDEDTLVGFTAGRARSDRSVELVGIAVDDVYTRRGIGSQLLAQFERNAAGIGYERVSLGSAGGYVDEFYVDNGYYPESILVRTTRAELPENHRGRFDVLRERDVDGRLKVYLAPKGFDQERVELVREAFDDPDAIYIMEQYL